MQARFAPSTIHHRASASRGFTLIELLVVIIVLGLLVGLVGPRLFQNVGKSKQAAAKAQIELFGAALERAELQHLEDAAAATDALAAVEERTAARDEDQQRDRHRQRERDEEEERRQQDVERPQHGVASARRARLGQLREASRERVRHHAWIVEPPAAS